MREGGGGEPCEHEGSRGKLAYGVWGNESKGLSQTVCRRRLGGLLGRKSARNIEKHIKEMSKTRAKSLAKTLQNTAKNCPKVELKEQKLSQNVFRTPFGRLLEAFGAPGRKREAKRVETLNGIVLFWKPFWHFWVLFGGPFLKHFWVPCRKALLSTLVSKGLPNGRRLKVISDTFLGPCHFSNFETPHVRNHTF